jgi:hypothetical protein
MSRARARVVSASPTSLHLLGSSSILVPSLDPVRSLPAAPSPSFATHFTAAEEAAVAATAVAAAAEAEEGEEEDEEEIEEAAVVAAARSAEVASDELTHPVTCTGRLAS